MAYSSVGARLLNTGMKLRGAHFDLRFGLADGIQGDAKAGLIVSVPKRQLKSAVDRNRVKRLIRETFRVGIDQQVPINVLVIYRSFSRANRAEIRSDLRAELGKLLRDGFARIPSPIHS